MGKHRDNSASKQEKEEIKKAQKETNRLVSGWLKKKLEYGNQWNDEKYKEYVALARASRQQDFMEICGVGDPANIDYDNPHVKILWLMCDPVNQRFAHNPKLRDRLYEQMDAETLDVYMNYVGERGKTYRGIFESRLGNQWAFIYRKGLDVKDKIKEKL